MQTALSTLAATILIGICLLAADSVRAAEEGASMETPTSASPSSPDTSPSDPTEADAEGGDDYVYTPAPDASEDEGWEYDPYYIFPLTRHMPDSELPLIGQIALYPLAFIIDLGQWPWGVLAGLAGK